MSSVVPPAPSVDPEPFQYGWRYVRRPRPDGTEELEMVPLTLLDVLHPQEDDHIPENSRHERHRRHFQDVFERRLLRTPTRLSLSDCLIDWDRTDLRGHCPDLIVLERDEPWPWRSWSTLHVRVEQARPVLIIEVVSPSTRVNDVVEKVAHYHRAGVPLYVIIDEERESGPLRLLGYRHRPAGYELLPLDEHGRLLLEPFGLHLVVVSDRVAVHDAATGEEMGDYVAVSEALAAEVRARGAAERARAEAERGRLEEAEARQAAEKSCAAAEQREREQAEARQAAEQARQAAEQARQAAEQARQAAEQRQREEAAARRQAEHQAALAAERLKELEAELQRLRGA